MQTTIEPSVVYHSWWPATVLLPRKEGERRQEMLHTCRVYATDAGLFVYGVQRRAGVQLLFSSPIDYSTTFKPVNGLPGYAHDVHTEAGLIVVTQTGGCGCGNPVKGYKPQFASRVAAWPA
jgi:hypothetical protein